jgi:predicted nucleic acid-binding protein
MSSNSVTNIYYVLRKMDSDTKARDFLRTILRFMSVMTVDHSNIMQALDSRFLDFEGGVQHFCAQKNQCDGILTRNIRDYIFSELAVMQPSEFVALYKG